MPLRNRVTPLSELIADPARGLVYGNRGCLHDREGGIRRRYNGKRWIACRLQFKGWQRRALLQPGKFTELFFLDEATAFAAGHRPCALCRREDYERFTEIWRDLHPGQIGADAMDAQLQAERVDPAARAQRHHEAPFDDLPDCAFVLRDDHPWLVHGATLLRWSPAGYDARTARPPASGRRWSPRRRSSRCCGRAGAERCRCCTRRRERQPRGRRPATVPCGGRARRGSRAEPGREARGNGPPRGCCPATSWASSRSRSVARW